MGVVAENKSHLYKRSIFLSKHKEINYLTFLETCHSLVAKSFLLVSFALCYHGLSAYPISHQVPSFPFKETLQHPRWLPICPQVCTHFCKGPWFAMNIHLFKTDTSIYSISSINLEVFCKHKVSLCLNLTKQLRWQSDHFQLIYALVNEIIVW